MNSEEPNLPSAMEPLVLPDGTKIDPISGEVLRDQPSERRFVEVPNASSAQKAIARLRRRVADLPLPPKQMSAIGVVVSYSLYGLDNEEIALATGLTVDQVGNIKMLGAYQEMYDSVVEAILATDADEVRTILASGAKKAARRVVREIESDNGDRALSAARDVLDRNGHRAADIVEHRHRMEGELRIITVKRDERVNIPTIDMEPTDGNREGP